MVASPRLAKRDSSHCSTKKSTSYPGIMSSRCLTTSQEGFAGLGVKIPDTPNKKKSPLPFFPHDIYLSAIVDLLRFLISLAPPATPGSTNSFTQWMLSHHEETWHQNSKFIQAAQTWIRDTRDDILTEWITRSVTKGVLASQPQLHALATKVTEEGERSRKA